MIATEEYLDFLRKEYLADFVRKGGATVKFVVAPDDTRAAAFSAGLSDAASSEGFTFARVDASQTRVHMIDQVFFAVAAQVDWDERTATFLRSTLERAAFPAPPESHDLSLTTLAAHHDFDRGELSRTVRRQLVHDLLYDHTMAQELRIAMLRLCEARLQDNELAAAEREALLAWLHGELRHISRLRSAGIFSRVARHNARHLLLSLVRWLTRTGSAGLVLELDIRRCAVTKRPPPEERSGVYYSKAAVMDAYEVLRQLVDATDELAYCCVVVVAAPEFVTDHTRGLPAYTALQMRIWDEVRDRRRDNPFSALVRAHGPA